MIYSNHFGTVKFERNMILCSTKTLVFALIDDVDEKKGLVILHDMEPIPIELLANDILSGRTKIITHN